MPGPYVLAEADVQWVASDGPQILLEANMPDNTTRVWWEADIIAIQGPSIGNEVRLGVWTLPSPGGTLIWEKSHFLATTQNLRDQRASSDWDVAYGPTWGTGKRVVLWSMDETNPQYSNQWLRAHIRLLGDLEPAPWGGVTCGVKAGIDPDTQIWVDRALWEQVTGAPAHWLTPFIDLFTIETIRAADLCALNLEDPPLPDVATIAGAALRDPSSIVDVYNWVRDKLRYVAFSMTCTCVYSQGASPASPPAPVQPTQPPLLTLPPSWACADVGDLCTRLDQISRRLDWLRRDVELIQRQSTPFGYVLGPIHAALTGHGQFAVQGILGLSVNITAEPSTLSRRPGTPVATLNYGWLSVGTPDGWLRGHPIRHDPQLIFDISGAVTLVGYTLEPGVTATVTELLREP